MIKSEKSIWSYSLYGDDYESYFRPLIDNIKIASESNAVVVLNVLDQDLERTRKYFEHYLDSIYIFSYDSRRYHDHPKILRFLVTDNIQSNFYFYKDSDSIVNSKEIFLMKDWLLSQNPTFMIVRDHHLHVFPILAGMFGANRRIANLLTESTKRNFFKNKTKFTNTYSYDQDWLRSEIYPKVVNGALVYSNYFYFSGECVKKTEKNNSTKKFIGAQENIRGKDIGRNNRYLWMYSGGMLQLPYFKDIDFIYKKVRVNLMMAYLYTRVKNYFGKSVDGF
jgi:hypothetical protein